MARNIVWLADQEESLECWQEKKEFVHSHLNEEMNQDLLVGWNTDGPCD